VIEFNALFLTLVNKKDFSDKSSTSDSRFSHTYIIKSCTISSASSRETYEEQNKHSGL
jgi:hypothetical protein